jgi:hypothetical protein
VSPDAAPDDEETTSQSRGSSGSAARARGRRTSDEDG